MTYRGSAADRAYARLLRQIIGGQRAPGEKLGEPELCRQLGVSRTPLREALVRLTREGLVERQRRCGCRVRSFDRAEIAELFECRAVLESAALALAGGQLPEAELNSVAELLNQAETSATEAVSASLAADTRLHELIVATCPNRHLAGLVRDLQLRTAPFRHYRSEAAADLSGLTAERRALLTALQKRDLETARRLLEAHIRQGASPCAPSPRTA